MAHQRSNQQDMELDAVTISILNNDSVRTAEKTLTGIMFTGVGKFRTGGYISACSGVFLMKSIRIWYSWDSTIAMGNKMWHMYLCIWKMLLFKVTYIAFLYIFHD